MKPVLQKALSRKRKTRQSKGVYNRKIQLYIPFLSQFALEIFIQNLCGPILAIVMRRMRRAFFFFIRIRRSWSVSYSPSPMLLSCRISRGFFFVAGSVRRGRMPVSLRSRMLQSSGVRGSTCRMISGQQKKRLTGVGPAYLAWEASVLPMYYSRIMNIFYGEYKNFSITI